MDGNLRIEQGPDGDLVLHLSDYAAHALLRRLTGSTAADVVENTFVDEAAGAIEQALQ